jgi:hypothetical protein
MVAIIGGFKAEFSGPVIIFPLPRKTKTPPTVDAIDEVCVAPDAAIDLFW